MQREVDPLRSTLDHLALDPRAQSDRPYLITMLRRLGYTEQQIREYLGETEPQPEPEPEPEPMPEPEAREPLPEDEGRLIEVEYTGPGLREFQLVVPISAEDAAEFDPHGLGAGLEAGTITIEGDPDGDELDAFLSGEGAISLDSEFAGDDEEFEAEADMEAEQEDGETQMYDDDGNPIDPSELEEAAADDDEFDDEGFDPTNPVGEEDESRFDTDPEDKFQVGQHPVEFKGTPVKSGKVRKLTPEEEAILAEGGELTQDDMGGESSDDDTSWPEEQVDTLDELSADEDRYWYDDWLLHRREQQRPDGTWTYVYFFRKGGRSPNGEPCAIPDGYEAVMDHQSGLPKLRLEGEEDEPQEWPEHDDGWGDEPAEPPRRRVRIKRVKAETQEEAENALRSQGKDVVRSVPVEYNEGDD